MSTPQSIHDPITPSQSATLPAWFWNVKPQEPELTKEEKAAAKRRAQNREANARMRERERVAKMDGVKAMLNQW